MFTWAIRHPAWGCVIQNNPCKGVVRNKETKRIRIVDDAEYMAVFNLASHNVQRLMTLVYRTLQRPSNLLIVGPANIARRIVDGLTVEVLRVKQGKTGAIVEIIMSEDLRDALFGSHTIECSDGRDSNYKESKYFIINRKGKPYTLRWI